MIDAPDRWRLNEMIVHAGKALTYLGDAVMDALVGNEEKLFAIIKMIEVVGESANTLTKAFREAHPNLPLRQAATMRHLLVHAYHKVDVEVVMLTVRDDFPPLIAQIRKILEDETP